MILLTAHDPLLRLALERAARADEDVVSDPDWVEDALQYGHPRVHVVDDRRGLGRDGRARVPLLYVSPDQVRSWDRERWRYDVPPPRVAYVGDRLAQLLRETSLEATWVDGLLAELARIVGRPLPLELRAFVRFSLELPRRYTDLSALAEATGLSQGALKARFRRRDLESPFTYLRWFRALGVAQLLADPSITVATAARALGFTSDTNMCRMVKVLTGLTPGDLRDPATRRWLRVALAVAHLTPADLRGWASLGSLFGRDRAA